MCKAHGPHYIVICGLPSKTYTKRHTFVKKLLNIKCLIFPTTSVCYISHSKKCSARHYHRCTYIGLSVYQSIGLSVDWSISLSVDRSSCEVPIIRQVLTTLEFYQWNFKKYWNIRFHENLPGGSRAVECREMGMMKLTAALMGMMKLTAALDGHVEANSCFRWARWR